MDAVTLGVAQSQIRNATRRNTVSLAGGNTTVTAAQVQGRAIELTAATATVIVTFPNAAFACRVTNSTDFAQTIKRAGATNTITLESGGSMELVA